MQGIYLITNKVNGKNYVGSSKNINARIRAHFKLAFNPNSPRYEYPLYRAIRKYGIEAFETKVLEQNIFIDSRRLREQYWIEHYQSFGINGYNQTGGGESLVDNQGDLSPKAKLSNEEVIQIRVRHALGEKPKQIYKDYDDRISIHTLYNIVYYDKWKHISREFIKKYIEEKGLKS